METANATTTTAIANSAAAGQYFPDRHGYGPDIARRIQAEGSRRLLRRRASEGCRRRPIPPRAATAGGGAGAWGEGARGGER